MQICFDKCTKAVDFTSQNKSYGLFYSEGTEADTNIHVHECCEVFLNVSGGKSFLIGDRVYDVKPGDLFIINQFEPHKITCDDSKCFARYVFQIHPAFIYSCCTELTDLSHCFYTRGDNISNRISLTKKECNSIREKYAVLSRENDYADDIIKNNTVLSLLVDINRLFLEGCEGRTYLNNVDDKVVKQTISFINANFSDNLSLDIIAKSLYISVNQLCRVFKKNLGTTVTKYIAGKRISEAKKLLKNGCSVSDTALQCGYRDYSSFIRTFKNTVGVSPGKYIHLN